MEDDVPSPPALERQPSKRARKKPYLTGVEPKEITNTIAEGEKTFSARSRPHAEKGCMGRARTRRTTNTLAGEKRTNSAASSKTYNGPSGITT